MRVSFRKRGTRNSRGTMHVKGSFLLASCLIFLLLGPGTVRAQGPDLARGGLDGWRASLNERLNQDLAELSSAARQPPSPLVVNWGRDERLGSPSTPQPLLAAGNSGPWLPAVVAILRAHGLPPELVGIAVVESGFDPAALSPKGARGLWQLMPETATRYGMVVNSGRDERLDPLKSTFAAARYLKDLYGQFQDWPLALAAYNAGENRVQRSLDRLGARDFPTLSRHAALPAETRRYVPAVLARTGPALGSFAGTFPLGAATHSTIDSASRHQSGSLTEAFVIFATMSPGSGLPTEAE